MPQSSSYAHVLPVGLVGAQGLYETATLTAALDLSTASTAMRYASILGLDPGGDHREVTLEAEATAIHVFRKILNRADAAENLVIKNDAGDTLATVNQNEEVDLYCNGTSWLVICIRPIALS